MPFDKRGWEIPDQTPIERPIGWKEPESMQSMIARLVRNEISRAAGQAGAETFEEADDFDVDDDPELKSPYELDAEVEQLPKWKEEDERRRAIEEAERRFVAGVRGEPEEEVPDGRAGDQPGGRGGAVGDAGVRRGMAGREDQGESEDDRGPQGGIGRSGGRPARRSGRTG